jgi:anaerobic magnesium-protoporphyrin IX monomethyl ester cyclase
MARVIFIQPPLTPNEIFVRGSKGSASIIPPLGIAYIAACLRSHGHECKIIDGIAEPRSLDEVSQDAAEYDVVGVTVVTAYVLRAIELLRRLKENPRCPPLVVGGPHVTALPESLLDHGADFAVVGEGEETMLELVDWLGGVRDKSELSRIRGLVYKNGSETIRTGQRPLIANLDTIPMPARDLLPMNLYGGSIARASAQPSHSLLASRGCPGACTFCSKKTFGREVRYFSPSRVVDEFMLLVRDYGAKDVAVMDDNFLSREDCVIEVCEQLRKKGFNKTFSVEARIDNVTERLLRNLKASGCTYIAYGFESGSQRILDHINKRETLDEMRRVVALTKQVGLQIRGYFMFGFPSETAEEMEQTIRFALELDVDVASFTLVIPFPGTADYLRAQESGSFDPEFFYKTILPEFNFPKEPVYVPAAMTADELMQIHRRAYNRYYFRPAAILRRLASFRQVSDISAAWRGGWTLLVNALGKR